MNERLPRIHGEPQPLFRSMREGLNNPAPPEAVRVGLEEAGDRFKRSVRMKSQARTDIKGWLIAAYELDPSDGLPFHEAIKIAGIDRRTASLMLAEEGIVL